MNFELISEYQPTGDQPEAIAQLTEVLLSFSKDFRVYRIPVLRFYGMLPSVRCIIFLKRQCEDCLFNYD